MTYRYLTSRTSPNQNARPGRPTSITIHWWGKPSGQLIGGIIDWLCQPRAKASAHYVITSGTVACIVDPDRRAWHSGSDAGNDYSIGLELDPNASQRAGTMATAAELIAGLRDTYGDLPLYPHRHWTDTECPGNFDLAALDRLARGHKPAPAPAAKPVGTTTAPAFPLPRRKGLRCYYGPAGGPITSVSGTGLNTLVPGDVYRDANGRWHSRGLAKWQARMIARGWTELESAGGADGRFGRVTEKVTRQFQALIGETVDGQVGPVTWRGAWEEPVL